MKSIAGSLLFIGCVCLFLAVVPIAGAQDAGATVEQLSKELQHGGVLTQSEAEAMKPSLENMVEQGADKADLESVISELKSDGVEGDELKKSVDSMNQMVDEGENPKEAGNVVSQAAKQAREQGLKGKDLSDKVHQAIAQRRTERNAEKAAKKTEKQEEKLGKQAEKEKKAAEKVKKEEERAKKQAEKAKKTEEKAKKQAEKERKQAEKAKKATEKASKQKGKK